MNQTEFDAMPITDELMFGEVMLWDENNERWWVGLIDGKPHRRRSVPLFNRASFRVANESRSAVIEILFLGSPDDRLQRAAANWGADQFGCSANDVTVDAQPTQTNE